MAGMSEDPVKRRPLSLSLRTLIVVISVLCVVFAVVANRANRQRRAVARLQEVNAVARYDYEERANSPRPTLPWLRKLLGIDYFDTATLVFFMGDKAHGEDLEILSDLPHVVYLNLEQSNLPGDALVRIEKLSNLKSIGLGGTNGTDSALEHLSRMPQLESITIDSFNRPGSHVTDQGLAHLSKLKKLSSLALNSWYITDAGLVHLQGLTSLEQLTLYDTRVTKEGVAQLQKKLPACKIRYGNRRPGRSTP
jgi:hypothetical protein